LPEAKRNFIAFIFNFVAGTWTHFLNNPYAELNSILATMTDA
jgi:hypothetical protein